MRSTNENLQIIAGSKGGLTDAQYLQYIANAVQASGGGGGAPTGAAGGDLGGTYPNPSVAKLGGTSITTTGTELNYVSGVTSAIQTQLNGKQASGSYITGASPAITTPSITTGINDTNSNSMLAFTATASAVNGFSFTNAATGGKVTFATTGTNSTVPLIIAPKGDADIIIGNSVPKIQNGLWVTTNSSTAPTTRQVDLFAFTAAMSLGSGNSIKFEPGVTIAGNPDLGIVRNGIGILEINNGTAGTFRDLKLRQLYVDNTNTAAGTTGNQTINKASGTVNIAAAGTTVTVTNSLCTVNSIVLGVIRTNDSTATLKNIVPGVGSFVITLTAAATAEVSIGFHVINQ